MTPGRALEHRLHERSARTRPEVPRLEHREPRDARPRDASSPRPGRTPGAQAVTKALDHASSGGRPEAIAMDSEADSRGTNPDR